MYEQKIDTTDAVPFAEPIFEVGAADQPIAGKTHLFAVMIVIGLPFILLGLLARFLWKDVKAIGRGIAIFYCGAAEELSRS